MSFIKRVLRLPLHWQIAIALACAFIAGVFSSHVGMNDVGEEVLVQHTILGIEWIEIYGFIGEMFLNALKMLIVPLIASAVITGVAGIGKDKAFARLGMKTLGYYVLTSLLAVVVGLAVVNLMKPGFKDGQPNTALLDIANDEDQEKAMSKVEGRSASDIVDIFKRMIPTNVIDTATNNGAMLPLIVFSLLFGFYMAQITGPQADTMKNFWQALYDVMIKITDLVMRFAPIGIFGLVAKVTATTGYENFVNLLWFFFSVMLALGIHFLVTMPLILCFLARVNPIKHYKAMAPALLTAFSTASSSATLPVTMECLHDNSGVSRRVTSFTTPLGATVNMDGTALYECVAVIFIAQLMGADLGIGTQLTTVILALLTSIGVAGVPSASLVAIVVILTALDINPAAIGVLMVFDRVLDMCRTAVNIFGDSCGAVVIARSEGEETNLVSAQTPETA